MNAEEECPGTQDSWLVVIIFTLGIKLGDKRVYLYC